jgi:hypothetical protein
MSYAAGVHQLAGGLQRDLCGPTSVPLGVAVPVAQLRLDLVDPDLAGGQGVGIELTDRVFLCRAPAPARRR